jgi:hypothetical protein
LNSTIHVQNWSPRSERGPGEGPGVARARPENAPRDPNIARRWRALRRLCRVTWHNKAADVVVDFARVPPFVGE